MFVQDDALKRIFFLVRNTENMFLIPIYIKLLYSFVSHVGESSPFVTSLSCTSSYRGSGNGRSAEESVDNYRHIDTCWDCCGRPI